MLKDLSIRSKLLTLIGLLMAGIVVNTVAGSIFAVNLGNAANALYAKGFLPAEHSLLVRSDLYKLRGDIYKLLLLPEEQDKTSKDILTDLAKIDSGLGALRSMESIVDDSVKSRIESTIAAIGEYRKAIEEISAKAATGDRESGKASMMNGAAHLARKKVDAESQALLGFTEAEVERAEHRTVEIVASTRSSLPLLAAAVLVAGAIGSFLLSSLIISSLKRMAALADRMGDGDLRADPSIEELGRDELGAAARSLGLASGRLGDAMRGVASTANLANESAREQLEMTRKLTQEADTNEQEAQSAAAATEQASGNMRTISRGAQVASASLESVSAAMEEMSASVTEIARNADRTRAMTGSSLDGAKAATRRMQELSNASKEIEAVIEMIVEISEQTKLLALNATIEAARAGEAGRGFAVVADEVKQLAKGTAEATDDIRRRVEAIRSTTGNAVEEIAAVVGNMEALGQSISSIAGAVEQQSATTREISRNIEEAVQGNKEIGRNLETGSVALGEISRDIQNVLQRSRNLRRIAGTAKELSQKSSDFAQDLSSEVGKFRF